MLNINDQAQAIATAYGALVTPHFFVFNKSRQLIYAGRATNSPKIPEDINTHDLEAALDQHFAGQPITTDPIGCSIKWKQDAPESCDI